MEKLKTTIIIIFSFGIATLITFFGIITLNNYLKNEKTLNNKKIVKKQKIEKIYKEERKVYYAEAKGSLEKYLLSNETKSIDTNNIKQENKKKKNKYKSNKVKKEFTYHGANFKQYDKFKNVKKQSGSFSFSNKKKLDNKTNNYYLEKDRYIKE